MIDFRYSFGCFDLLCTELLFDFLILGNLAIPSATLTTCLKLIPSKLLPLPSPVLPSFLPDFAVSSSILSTGDVKSSVRTEFG